MLLRLSTLFALLFLVMMACQNLVSEIDPSRLPKIDRKLVVNGYLSPQDTLLAVSVSSSQTTLGDIVTDSVNTISDATVRLSGEGKTVMLSYNPQQRVYTVNARTLPIVVGKTYTLQVSVADYETVSSSCTVPKSSPITELKLDSTRSFSGSGQTPTWDYMVRAVWQDQADETNQYRIAGYGECVSRIPVSTTDSTTKAVLTRANLGFGREDQYISDQNQDGQLLISSRGELPAYFDYSFYDSKSNITYTGNFPFAKPLTIRVSVLQTDEHYYNYHRARQQQRLSQNNPFAEPVLMPTNIQGGLGCFGAYNRSTMAVILK